MARRLIPTVLAAFLLCPPHAAAQDCERDSGGTDDAEANFEVSCESEDMTVAYQPDGEVSTAKLQARKKEEEETVSVMFITVSTTQNFGDTGAVRLVADGTEMEAPLQRTGDSKRMEKGLTFEVKRLPLSQPKARQVSRADTVRLETGETTFRLDPLLGQLREVLRLANQ